jgi:hypothetical protein
LRGVAYVSVDPFDFLAGVFDYVVNDAVYCSLEGFRDCGKVCVAVCRSFGLDDFNRVCTVGVMFGNVLIVMFSLRVDIEREESALRSHFDGSRQWLNDVRFGAWERG